MKFHSRRRRKGEPSSELAEDVERLSRLVYREVPSSLQDEQSTEQVHRRFKRLRPTYPLYAD